MSTQIFGHRGASRAHPENTLAAFDAAASMGAVGIEFDVRRTADDLVVVHHDAHLADGRAIIELRSDELPPSVPLLSTVVETTADLTLNVEIKSDRRDPDFDEEYRISGLVLEILEDAPERSMITSFDLAAVDRLAGNNAGIPTGVISQLAPDWGHLVDTGHRVVAPWYRIVTEAMVAEAHTHGLTVGVWTVNKPEDLLRMSSSGVDFVMTDVPDVATLALSDVVP